MVSSEEAQQLGSEPIGRLLAQYSLPAITAMVASSVYNLLDRIFIGHGVGPMAISGLALTLPLMNLLVAFGALVGTGAATLVSIRLGEKRLDQAIGILGNTVLLNLVLSSTISLAMLVFLAPVLRLFGASPATLPYARQFMQILLLGNVFQHSYMGLNNVMRASGHPRRAMLITLLTVAVNAVLAPLFIFGFHWGIRGAASATVIAQFAGLVGTLVHFAGRSPVRFTKGCFRPDRRMVKDIVMIGMPAFILNTCASLVVILLNLKLVVHGGDYAVGAYGIFNCVLMCVAMVIIGLTQGMQPIAGYNFGAGQLQRVTGVLKQTIVAAMAIAALGFLLGELVPRPIALLFTRDARLVDLACTGMRLGLLVFPVVGFQMVASSFFQAIGHPVVSIVLALSRQIFCLVPALLLLPWLLGLNGVWLALPAADLVSSVVAFFVLRRGLKALLVPPASAAAAPEA
ncbi:MAG TPA: MATE family efflux transporter [Holophaga sp.]|nr:MATE family efflux transporter [Holophaga sp.]